MQAGSVSLLELDDEPPRSPYSVRGPPRYKRDPTSGGMVLRLHQSTLSRLHCVPLTKTKMLSRVATFALAVMPLLAAATPLEVRGGGGEPPSSCSTGPIQCCNTVTQVSHQTISIPALLKDSRIMRCIGQRPSGDYDPRSARYRPPGPERPRRLDLLPHQRHRCRRQQHLLCQRGMLPGQQQCEYLSDRLWPH